MLHSENTKKMIGDIFLDIANGIESGQFGEKTRIGLTTLGSEHGVENLIKGAEIASKKHPDMKVVLIGPKADTTLETIIAKTEEEMYEKMEELLDNKYLNSCVTMHYNFPIGVSTVGKVITPGLGKEMFIATTTGTTSVNRVESMIKNAVNGIIAAKSTGIENPTIGILNVDGAKQVEIALKKLKSKGYEVNFGESLRADGGCIMRGNDLLTGSVDVMVTDTLTGNILMKMFSSFTTGGSYESSGYGYGPGIGENFHRNILILSRASGVPVVTNALEYGMKVSNGNISKIIKDEYEKSNKAGLKEIIKEITKEENPAKKQNIQKPEKEVVTAQISGIDIMDLEDAVKVLWKEKIYAESGMGCTGPIVLVSDNKFNEAICVLQNRNYIVSDKKGC
ncbi:MAG: glycine/sarcosine/betaine reductase complex component C subunit alpha [Bacillota bacterium]|nr:glycine/sarcosine/betaine reductase complex component C subunit alpha [Bacillota bacterium]